MRRVNPLCFVGCLVVGYCLSGCGSEPDQVLIVETPEYDTKVADTGNGGCVALDNEVFAGCIGDPSGCFSLQSPFCDDGSGCTVDLCFDGGACANVPLLCSDGDVCTVDACDPAVGCVFSSVDCVDGSLCSQAVCDPSSGCLWTYLDCDDGDVCTLDVCFPESGCNNTPTDCDDGVACTVDLCDPVAGCVHVPDDSRCDGDPVCLTWVCDGEVGCLGMPVDSACDDGDLCTLGDHCLDGECGTHRVLSCDDGDVCTDDVCDPTVGCIHTPGVSECDDGDSCTVERCDGVDGCVYDLLICDDGNACTIDQCDVKAGCFTAFALSCKDNDPCTVDECNPSVGCVFSYTACDDGNACTDDICTGDLECSYADVSCVDGSVCTSDICDPDKGCTFQFAFLGCTDVTGCLVSYCHPLLGCMTTELQCNSTDPCLDGDCIGGSCKFKPRVCDSGNPCKLDACEPGVGCVKFDHNPCDDDNTATINQCISKVGCSFEKPGDPICNLVGMVGDEILCPINVVRPYLDPESEYPTALAAAVQATLRWNNKEVEFVHFEEIINVPGFDIVVVKVPPGVMYPTGHVVITNPQSPLLAQKIGEITFMALQFNYPNLPVSTAKFNEAGEVEGDPTILWIRFRLLQDLDEGAPAEVHASVLAAGASDDAYNEAGTGLTMKVEDLTITWEKSFCDTQADCDDDNVCTGDWCDDGEINMDEATHQCVNALRDPAYFGLVVGTCDEYKCDPKLGGYLVPKYDCDDGNACTKDECGAFCTHTLIDPDDGNSCTADFCDPKDGVFHLLWECNDNKACTIDKCVQGIGCTNLLKDCSDGAACSLDYCDKGICEHDLKHDLCDDGDPDTLDYCAPDLPEANEMGCLHVAK